MFKATRSVLADGGIKGEQNLSMLDDATIKIIRPALWRRVMAAIIDRLVPLPFLAFLFPKWLIVVVLYHLLCDCSPERRSFGKWVCRLRVISNSSATSCQWWQTALRRLGIVFTQAAWCLWDFIPLVLVYELCSLACLLLSPQGMRLEDYLANTRVITEKSFRLRQKLLVNQKQNSEANHE